MKIAVATNDGTTVSAHAGRCREFYIYEAPDKIDLKKEFEPLEVIPNQSNSQQCHNHDHNGHHGHHGHGEHQSHTHVNLVQKLSGVEVLLCKSCGPSLIADLNRNGIKVLGVKGRDMNQIVSDFFFGKAKTHDAPDCGHHHEH